MSNSQFHSDQRKPLSSTKLGCGIVSILVVLVVAAMALSLARKRAIGRARLSQIIAKIEASGEPFSLEELAKSHVIPEGETDLTQEYLAAMAPYAKGFVLPEEFATVPVVGSRGGNVPAKNEVWLDIDLTERYLQTCERRTQAFRELGKKNGRVFLPHKFADGFTLNLSEVQSLRAGARDLRLEFAYQMRKGNADAAFDSLRASIKASDALKEEPILVSQLVRIALASISSESTQEFLSSGKATAEQLRELKALWSEDLEDGLGKALMGERAMSFHAMHLDLSKLGTQIGTETRYLRGTAVDMLPGDCARLLEFETEAIAAAKAPFPESTKRLAQIGTELKALADQDAQAMAWDRHMLTNLMTPSMNAIGRAFSNALELRIAIQTAIDLELEQAERGAPFTETEWEEAAKRHARIDPSTLKPSVIEFDATGYSITTGAKVIRIEKSASIGAATETVNPTTSSKPEPEDSNREP